MGYHLIVAPTQVFKTTATMEMHRKQRAVTKFSAIEEAPTVEIHKRIEKYL